MQQHPIRDVGVFRRRLHRPADVGTRGEKVDDRRQEVGTLVDHLDEPLAHFVARYLVLLHRQRPKSRELIERRIVGRLFGWILHHAGTRHRQREEVLHQIPERHGRDEEQRDGNCTPHGHWTHKPSITIPACVRAFFRCFFSSPA